MLGTNDLRDYNPCSMGPWTLISLSRYRRSEFSGHSLEYKVESSVQVEVGSHHQLPVVCNSAGNSPFPTLQLQMRNIVMEPYILFLWINEECCMQTVYN